MRAGRVVWLPRVALYALALVLVVWVLAPIYLITLGAFSTEEAVYQYPRELAPTSMSTETVSFFIKAAGVKDALQRSVIVAALTLGIALLVGAPAGYALARFRFAGGNVVQLAVVSTRAFPIVIIAIPLAVTFIGWGIDDSVYSVALAHAAFALPFVVLTTASVFAGISSEYEEAAMTLGCSRLGAFRRVALPLALPGLAAASIFTLLLSWNEVFAASILTLTNRTLPALVLTNLDTSPLPYRFAGGFFLMAPSLIVVFVIRRYLFTMFGRVAR